MWEDVGSQFGEVRDSVLTVTRAVRRILMEAEGYLLILQQDILNRQLF